MDWERNSFYSKLDQETKTAVIAGCLLIIIFVIEHYIGLITRNQISYLINAGSTPYTPNFTIFTLAALACPGVIAGIIAYIMRPRSSRTFNNLFNIQLIALVALIPAIAALVGWLAYWLFVSNFLSLLTFSITVIGLVVIAYFVVILIIGATVVFILTFFTAAIGYLSAGIGNRIWQYWKKSK